MNAVSKGRLQSLFLNNGPRVGNGQRGSAGLGLVDWRPKGSFDKACFNVLRAEDVRRVGARPSTEQDEEAGIGGDNGAGTGRDNEVGTGGDNEPGTGGLDDEPGTGGRDEKPGTGGQDDKPGTRGRDGDGVGDLGHDNGAGTGGQGDERVAEPAASAFRIGAQRLSHRAFLLAARSDTFLALSFSESVIG